MKCLFSVCLVFLFAQDVSAAVQCPQASIQDKVTKSVDRRKEIGPIRDQDSTGWCYAFVAADLLTHYLSNNGQKFLPQNTNASLLKHENMVSPVGLAHFYNQETSPNYYNDIKNMNSTELAAYNKAKAQEMKALGKSWKYLNVVPESGMVQKPLEEALERGFCLEKDAPSESFSHVLAKICSERKLCATNLMDVLKLIYDKTNKDTLRSLSPDKCDLYVVAKAAYPSIPEAELKNIVYKTSRDKVYYDLAEAACDRELRYMTTKIKPTPKSEWGNPGNNNNLFIALDKKLEEGQIVGMVYYSAFLVKPGAERKSPHASSIVGKRFNPQNCQVEYILRNSWGPTCGHYYKENEKLNPCLKSKEMNDPQFFKAFVNELNKKIKEKDQEIASLQVILNFQTPGTPVYKQMMTKMSTFKEIKRILSEQSSFYGKTSQGLYPLKSKFCGDKYKPEPRNPAVVCDKTSNYIYVQKNELKKYMFGVTYF